jgi:pyruvate dehydrogenase E2 component (dihydrolipoamide acetyltransferase)
MIEVGLPSLGADMDEGTLLRWCVAPGDAVRKGQVIAVVDTTKAALDVESWHEGIVHELLAEPGQTLAVGTPILRLLAAGEPVPAGAPGPDGSRAAAAAPGSPLPAATTSTTLAAAPPAGSAEPGRAVEPTPARRRVSPAARRLAAELGVDLAQVAEGADGTIALADVERAAAAAVPAGEPPPARVVERAAGLRRTIAAAMSRAKREIPHYYLGEQVALGPALDWLAAANAGRPPATRLLLTALCIRAVALAAREHRDFNGWYSDDRFRPADAVHVGVAVALRGGGLLAPAIMHADEKPLDAVMTELRDLVARTRAGSLQRRELTEGTITLTHLGEEGVQQVYGIVYAPQVALVGVGGIAVQPWVAGDRLVPERTAWLTLSADHRVTDGHAGSRFLAAVAARLRDPATP